MKAFITALTITLTACALAGCTTEYHVSATGLDSNPGTRLKPFKTISAAAAIAQPGDVVTVHEGVYREQVNPPRGGESDDKRIVYRAANGEKVVIKGSELVKGWKKVEGDVWKVTLPNSFFGDFNPYSDLISGDWFRNHKNAKNHTGAVYLNGNWLAEKFTLAEVTKPINKTPVWFAQVDDKNTTIWAQFKGVDPNKENVEVNVRQTVFYPEKTGINYITLRGFTLEQAATPWAPPTAEQIGLIGTHWSKGWVIEDNTVRHSACSGIALGKHGDEFDNKAESAFGYNQTIKRALKRGWSKENIGHHVVRNNHISHCGQAGVVGSMGAVFSKVTGNVIHDIHRDRTFGGAEMAGIKFHGAIDTVISNNHIYRCGGAGGIWLDWMTQGTRVTGNLLHDNSRDLFVEVNHGPFLIDNNIFLSSNFLLDMSQGGAYSHNLIAGDVKGRTEKRQTPYFKPHSMKDLKLSNIQHKDLRFYNNMFTGSSGLSVLDKITLNTRAVGNVYLAGAKPSANDKGALVDENFDPSIKLQEKFDGWWLEMAVDPDWTSKQKRNIITTELLGKAKIPDAFFEQPDGTPYRLDTDYFGKKRNLNNPSSGPFENPGSGRVKLKVWPRK